MSQIANQASITIFTNAAGDQFVTVGIQASDDQNPAIRQSAGQTLPASDLSVQSMLIEANKLLAVVKAANGIS